MLSTNYAGIRSCSCENEVCLVVGLGLLVATIDLGLGITVVHQGRHGGEVAGTLCPFSKWLGSDLKRRKQG